MYPDPIVIEEDVYQDLIRVGKFYDVDEAQISDSCGKLFLDEYVEIILGETGFELVIGGHGKEQELVEIARSLNFSPELIQYFQDFAHAFPEKIAYLKIGFGKNPNPPTMYFAPLEPWASVFEFLETLPSIRSGIPALQEAIGESKICSCFGFTSDPKNEALVVKAYHLLDRLQNNAPQKPFLLANRLSNGKLLDGQKQYTFGVQWEQLNTNDRWRAISDFAQPIFGNAYLLIWGETLGARASEGSKVYIFRLDSRENNGYQMSTYNYYTDAGLRLVQLQQFEDAVHMLQNAIDLKPDDGAAHHYLGNSLLHLKQYAEGIEYTLKAKALLPQLYGIPPNIEQTGMVSEEVPYTPSEHSHNARGLFLFQHQQYPEALAEFEKAIALNPLNADAYNNAGGACLLMGSAAKALVFCEKAATMSRKTNLSNLRFAQEMHRLNQLIEQQPNADLYNVRGLLHYRMMQFDRAKSDFMKALELVQP